MLGGALGALVGGPVITSTRTSCVGGKEGRLEGVSLRTEEGGEVEGEKFGAKDGEEEGAVEGCLLGDTDGKVEATFVGD